MTATPSPDFIDPVRRDAVRRLLHDTVQDEAHAAPAVRRRRVMRFAALAAVAVVLGGGGLAYAGLTSRAPGGGTAVAPPITSAPAPSSSPTVAPTQTGGPEATSEPAGTSTPLPTPTPTPPVDPAVSLQTAPVPSLCRHPAGTLSGGRLPGQDPSTGEVVLSQLADSSTPVTRYYAAGAVAGIGPNAVAASLSCNAGGVPWADVIVLYRATGSTLQLIGSYSLDTQSQRVAVTSTVTISDGSVLVTWTGPTPDEPDSGGGLAQSVRLTVSNGSVVATDYTAVRH